MILVLVTRICASHKEAKKGAEEREGPDPPITPNAFEGARVHMDRVLYFCYDEWLPVFVHINGKYEGDVLCWNDLLNRVERMFANHQGEGVTRVRLQRAEGAQQIESLRTRRCGAPPVGLVQGHVRRPSIPGRAAGKLSHICS
jgi:hypothetical protein